MPVFLNLLPNIYWCYNNPAIQKSMPDFNIEVRKFCEYNGIKNRVDIDENLEFWGKSNNYINEIKQQMQKDEFSKLLVVFKKMCDTITTAYQSNSPTIIVSYNIKYIDIGLGFWVYFFNQNCGGISFDSVLKIIGLKIVGNLHMSENLKRFFMLLNAN